MKNNKNSTATADSPLPSATCYVVAGKGKLTEGQEYEVRNQRKGTFQMRVTKIDDEWITGMITEGVASAMMRYNVRDVGEEVTVRACHSHFIPIAKTT
jgi:transcriptional regulator CtsR